MFSDEKRAEIGRYAAENGNNAALEKFRRDIPDLGKSQVINPRRACAARVIVVCLSVCYHYSGTTGYEAAKERYQRPERYVGIVFKKAIFLKLLRSRVTRVKKPIC